MRRIIGTTSLVTPSPVKTPRVPSPREGNFTYVILARAESKVENVVEEYLVPEKARKIFTNLSEGARSPEHGRQIQPRQVEVYKREQFRTCDGFGRVGRGIHSERKWWV